MWRKFWICAVALLFIICLASVVDAQHRPNSNGQGASNSNSHGNSGNGNQGENPGNGNQGENPGNGNQGENPGNGNQGENPGNGSQGQNRRVNPGHGTPDGQTPAEENICDDLRYATPGLYGLCIAFCEAHDSDCEPNPDNPEDPFGHCARRDARILTKYNQKKKDGDPDMPCLPAVIAGEDPATACPCWSQETLEFFPFSLTSWEAESSNMYCEMDTGEDCFGEDPETEEEFYIGTQYTTYVSESSNLPGSAVFYFRVEASTGACDGTYCSGDIGCFGADCPQELIFEQFGEMEISQDDYENCRLAIEQLADTFGVYCGE